MISDVSELLIQNQRMLFLGAGMLGLSTLLLVRRLRTETSESSPPAVATTKPSLVRAPAALDSDHIFKLLVQGVTDFAIYMLTPEGHVANWNAGAQRNKGYAADEIIGRHFSCFFAEEERQQGLPDRMLMQARLEGRFTGEGWRYRKDGSRFWASVHLEPIHDDSGNHIGFAKITHDDSRKHEDAQEIARISSLLQLAMNNMTQGLALFDVRGRLVLANQRLGEVLDLPVPMRGDPVAAGLTTGGLAELIMSRRAHGVILPRDGQHDYLEHLRDGRIIRVVHRLVEQRGTLSTYEDVSARRRAEARVEHMARHDALTGLPNRMSFGEKLGRAMATLKADAFRAPTAQLAVICIDLDRFKEINDHFGHAAGDEVLRILSQRMARCFTGTNLIARFGGDEFAAYVRYENPEDLDTLLATLEREITARITLDVNEVSVGASIGVALYPQDSGEAEKLISNADMAMYRAKGSVTERICYYHAEMDEAVRERRQLARDLWRAIEHSEFLLHYQVQKSVKTEEVTGYEVLLRWIHPMRGSVSPAEFIPVAEESGAILPIGAWVLRAACREAATWNNGARIAVNLSPVQLASDDIVGLVAGILQETGLDPARLELEVTESTIIADKARALNILRQIKILGVTIAIDDFGTGYSSLETLRSFPFDKIKLDRSFLTDLEDNRQSRAILRAILALGDSLDVPVLAEGVETVAQLALLKTEGCDEAQGFYLGRPQPAASVEQHAEETETTLLG